MSDEAPKPPKPMKKTSAVPLKKETVKVTLKATDAEGAPAPAPPVAKKPAIPTPGDAPAAPKAPTAAIKPPTATAKAPTPAPTVPLKTAAPSAPKAPAPAPTVPLKTGAPAAPASTPLKTQPLTPAGDGTTALPKATVPLGGGTQQLGKPTGLQTTPGTIGGFDDDEEEEVSSTLTGVLAIFAFVAALAAFAFQFLTAQTWASVESGVSRTLSDIFNL